jgi:acyl CoA:acetate/3-ketoacid CoA transferase alpha subunit
MDKQSASAAEAVADIPSGATIAVGGFGLSGVPITLVRALLAGGATDLEVVSNNCGVDGWGLGLLLSEGRIRRIIASYIGENKEFARQYLGGEVEVELAPDDAAREPQAVGAEVPEGGRRAHVAPPCPIQRPRNANRTATETVNRTRESTTASSGSVSMAR